MTTSLVTILKNEWDSFEQTSKSAELKRNAVRSNIWKVIHCKTLWMGLQIYQCEDHKDVVRLVPCTCKSRFCPSCGYKANLIWLNELLGRVLPCNYQHLVFTLPYELRDLAKNNRRLVFNLMSQCLSKSIKLFISKHESLGYVPGIVSILHTFGKGMKWHPHFHVLITAGGLKNGKWVKNSYLNEKSLKKSFKAKMLAGFRKLHKQGKLVNAVGRHPCQTFGQMLSEIYEKNWYVWVDEARGNGIVAFQYIGRYCKRACISQKGIVEYHEGKLVAWKERSKIETPNLCAYRETPNAFIDLLIQHIPNNYDHQVRYYGLYASRNKNTLYVKACKIFKKKKIINGAKSFVSSGFNNLLRLLHGVEPMTCPICKKQLKLAAILFLTLSNPSDRDLLLNYEVKNYELVAKSSDTS